MILLIDNYDSFTYNLVQLLGGLGAEVRVVRNDAIDLAAVEALDPSHVIISPGPGHPANPGDFGICHAVIVHGRPSRPLLGVCLGHQGLALAFGGQVVRAPAIVHGKTSPVRHDGVGVFAGVPDPVVAMRYHSLVVDAETVPPCLRVTARTEDGLVMGLRHEGRPLHGMQFHPESFATPHGARMIANFLEMG